MSPLKPIKAIALAIVLLIDLHAEEVGMSEIAEKLRTELTSLNQIQFAYTYSYPIKDRSSTGVEKVGKLVTKGKFYSDGIKFAFDLTTDTPNPLPSNKSFFSYNGLSYYLQLWGPELRLSKNIQSFGQESKQFMLQLPTLIPFLFLYSKDSVFDYSAIQQPEIWQQFLSKSELIGMRTVDNKKLLCIQHKRTPEITDILYLDPDHSFYPIRVETIGPAGKAIANVLEFIESELDGTSVLIPTQIEVENFFPNGKPVAFPHKYTIDKKSVIRGQKMPQDVLVPPYSQVGVTHDLDLGVYLDRPVVH